MISRTVAVVLVLSLPVGCAPTVVPPPTIPEQVLPEVGATAPPPAAGEGQVAIATVDESALVEQVTGHYEAVGGDGFAVDGLTYATVCSGTPCVANLPIGAHVLRFTSVVDPGHNGTGTITVGAQPSAYRYALGHNVDPSFGDSFGGALALTYGGFGVIGGAIMIGLGRTTTTDFEGTTMPGPDLRPYGIGTLIVGAGLLALGWHLVRGSGGAVQGGAGVQWLP